MVYPWTATISRMLTKIIIINQVCACAALHVFFGGLHSLRTHHSVTYQIINIFRVTIAGKMGEYKKPTQKRA
jgi:hypothetical protein